MRFPLLQAIVLAATVVASPCRAEGRRIVLAPPHLQGAVPPSVAANVVASLERAMTAAGWDVLHLPPSPNSDEPCSNNTCALAHASTVGAEAALQVSLFAHPQLSFYVALVQPPGDAFVHAGTLTETPTTSSQAMASAVQDLLAQQARGPGPWLAVKGSPLDATVRLDGDVVGTLPLRRRIRGGEHLLLVEAPGHSAYNTTIWLEDMAGAFKEVAVRLTPTVPESRPATRVDEAPHGVLRPSGWDWAVGGAVAGLGMSYLAVGLAHHLRAGQCLEREGDVCVREADTGPRTRTQLALGASATAFGVGWLLVAPFARWVRPEITSSAASVSVQGEF